MKLTTEEALAILDTIPTIGEQVDALEMAIESMKHVPCYLDSPCEYQNKDIKIPKVTASGWNVITKCPMDADEIATWSENLGYEIPDDEAFMYGNLPEEGVEVLVCTASGTIFIDSLCCDEWCYFEEYGEMDGIVAWMPLPKPYKEVEE